MKKILPFLFILFVSHTVFADSPATELEQRINALSKAMIDADEKSLQSLTATALNYGHSSGRVEDQKTFISNLVNGSSNFVTIELQEQNISMVGDIAIVRHILTGDTNDSGKPGSVRIGVMMVWQKQQGNGPYLRARHSSCHKNRYAVALHLIYVCYMTLMLPPVVDRRAI